MTERRNAKISERKRPKQARSSELVSAILQAATQVLEQEGATRFTTARVAERAGVSIGSLYQYFPNKAAILFRLQSEEWQRTGNLLGAILRNSAATPCQRLHDLTLAFLQSECEEAAMRTALNDAAPLYRDAPEVQEAQAAGENVISDFLLELLPHSEEEDRARAADLINSTLGNVGKHFSESPRTAAEIKAYAHDMAEMFCAWIREKGADIQ
ncbi:TetR family transcriptional regulator [Pantoea sp. BIGb0393]|uniref:TetR family transcriptional regulator n=1 Tax=Pantoea nemavictus TaxID=2726955 RepID=A0ABU8PZ92_9GAMM|nr:TetR family transcriptional regulator [Pantoea nemavictus]MBA0038957.1 TetR family transcriptional regulator [Pantoea nemavictus]